ncbi:MAG: hypothetical protein ACOX33_07625 [Dethiobacteria bacterium]|jgi:hypothetical protein
MDFYPVLDNPLQDEVKCNPHKAGMKSRGAGMEARPYAFVILGEAKDLTGLSPSTINREQFHTFGKGIMACLTEQQF